MIHAMRRWRWVLLILILIASCAFAIHRRSQVRTQKKREESYQVVLRSYSTALRIGTTRKDVEDYLHAKDIDFKQMCCADMNLFSKNVYDDLVKIGEEDVPWVCEGNNVYVALQFRGPQPRNVGFEVRPDDTLMAVTIFHQLERCP